MHKITVRQAGKPAQIVRGWSLMALLKAYWERGIDAHLIDSRTIQIGR